VLIASRKASQFNFKFQVNHFLVNHVKLMKMLFALLILCLLIM